MYDVDMDQSVQLGYLGNWGKLLTGIVHLLGRVRVASAQNCCAIAVLTAIIPCQERVSAKVRQVLSFQL